jgi:uncharacterized protein
MSKYQEQLNYLDPKTIDVVLYHGGCPDGFGSAFAAWLLLSYSGKEIKYQGVNHLSALPDVRGKRVILLDICFKSQVIQDMIQTADKLLVIDHHHTAMQELEHIPTKHKIFDMNHAGCILAWDYFFGTTSKPTPQFLYYIEDRDLWVWKLTKSKEICAAIDLYPQTFIAWSKFYNQAITTTDLSKQGEAILLYRQRIIDDIVSKSKEICFQGLTCRVVNSTGGALTSDVAVQLLQNHKNIDIAMTWYEDHQTGNMMFSLRSPPHIDCSIIAKLYGGGGHKQACGFSVSLDKHDEIKSIIYKK